MNERIGDPRSHHWHSIADCVDAYEAACGSTFPDPTDYVARLDPSLRDRALLDLLKVQIELRWKAGRGMLVEEYQQRYAALLKEADALTELVLWEYRIRRRTGEPISTDDLRRRFPDLKELAHLTDDMMDDVTTIYNDASSERAGNVRAPEAARARLAPSTRIGKYEVVRFLGEGSFGAVYLCRDKQLQRIAIKVQHARTGQSWGSEGELLHGVRVAMQLNHPAVVQLLDFGRTKVEGRTYYVYQYIEGETLKAWIRSRKYSHDDAARWVAEIADALHHAHQHEIFHRDVKPENILVDGQGRAHLADFGLARIGGEFFTDDAGKVLGTLLYMSPEQASGQSDWVTSQSDIYSLGVVFYELLCRRPPFEAPSPNELLKQVRQRTPNPPRSLDDTIPKELERICLIAMAKKPGDRYTMAGDLAQDLRAYLATTSTAAPRPAKRLGKRGVQIGSAVLAALVVLAVVAPASYRTWRTPASVPAGTPNSAPETSEPVGEPETSAPGPTAVPSSVQPAFDAHIYYQAADSVNQMRMLRAQHLPLRDGDKVKLSAKLPEPGYVYVFWCDARGVKRLWPERFEDLRDSPPNHEIWFPYERTLWYEIGGAKGTELAIVAVAPKRLTSNQLQQLDRMSFDSPVDLAGKQALFSMNYGGSSSPTIESDIERGIEGKVQSPERILPQNFEEQLGRTFRWFKAFLMPHE